MKSSVVIIGFVLIFSGLAWMLVNQFMNWDVLQWKPVVVICIGMLIVNCIRFKQW